MLYFASFFGLCLISLAMISRKCFSKYKGKELFSAAAGFLTEKLRKTVLFESLKQEIRRSETMNERKAEEETAKLISGVIGKGLKLVFVLDILVIFLGLLGNNSGDPGRIKRPKTGDDPVKISLVLKNGSSESDYELELQPREYSSDEFREMADKAYTYLDGTIKGNNKDLENIMYDLELPKTDESGTLMIEWRSDDTLLIAGDGTVYSREISSAKEVKLTAVIKDGRHDTERTWKLRVVPYKVSGWVEKAEEELRSLEEESRNDKELILPDSIDGVTVKKDSDEGISTVCKVFIFGIILIIVYMILLVNKVKKRADARQEEMLHDYSYFVSSIVLKMSSGLSIRETMISICEDMKKRGGTGGLYEELLYVVNGLRNGRDERTVYSEMARSSGIGEYRRLMSLIVRNLERGNSNLLELLQKEEKDAFNERKLRARKKGEEAAEKLLIPMFILLITVIGIVMFPAIKNF